MKENKLCHHWTRTGRRDLGEKCRFKHESQAGEDNAHGLTEERLASAFEEMRMRKVREEDGDDEDDDVVIVSRQARSDPKLMV